MVVALDATRFVVGMSFLALAAASDVRTRRVANRVWVAMGSVGLVVLAVQIAAEGDSPAMYLALIPAAALFFTVFYGRELRDDRGWHFATGPVASYVAGAAAAIAGWSWLSDDADARLRFLAFLSAAAMMLVFRLFYQVHLLKGGADAKALMAVALLVPTYPVLPGLPLVGLDPRLGPAISLAFPFAFLVLLNAALLSVLVPLGLLAYNASRGHAKFPEGLFGVKVPLDAIPKFAWLMDRIVDGEHVVYLMPRGEGDRTEDLQALHAAGFREVWVTPQIPFVVAIAIGYIVSFVVGNVLVGAFQAFA